MAHYAKVLNGKVVNVIVAEPEFFDTFIDDSPGEWIETSYGSYGGEHKDKDSKGTEHKRYNYAGIGCDYDREMDAFVMPMPKNDKKKWKFMKEEQQWKEDKI